MTLTFSNPGDGYILYTPDPKQGESNLRLPHHAPTTAYQKEMVWRYEETPNVRKIKKGSRGNPDYDTNYFFRVRTETDNEGSVTGGLYGKIYGEFNWYNYTLERKENKPFVAFNYYLNPTEGDTNIEYDIKKNLFSNTPDRHEVSKP